MKKWELVQQALPPPGISPPLGNWLGRYYASLAIDGTPRVGKWVSANASPLLRAFQPVTCRFPMLLWLGEESPRPPLPKADPKHSHMRSLKRGWTARSPRRNGNGAFLPAIGVPQKGRSFHLAKGTNFNIAFCFQGCHLTVVQKGGDITIAPAPEHSPPSGCGYLYVSRRCVTENARLKASSVRPVARGANVIVRGSPG